MRNFLCLLLALAQIPWSTACMASDLDSSINAAKSLRNVLNDSFESYLRSAADSVIKTNYLYIFWDHAATQRALAERSSAGLTRLYQLQNEFKNTVDQLSRDDGNWEENATHALALVAQAQDLRADAQTVGDDVRFLQQSWLQACRKDSQAQIAQMFNPMAKNDVMAIGDVSAPTPNYEFNVQISASYGGDGTSVTGASANTGKKKDGDGVAEAGGIAITVGVALCCTPATVIVGVVLIVLGVLAEIYSAMEEACKAAAQEHELADLRKEIRDIQLKAMNQVGAEIPGIVNAACTASFPTATADQLPLEIFAKYLNATASFVTDISGQRSEIYRLYDARLKRLASEYYPQVEKVYLGLIDQRFAKANDVAQAINQSIQQIVRPLANRLKISHAIGGLREWNDEQDLWSTLIQLDSQYRTRPGFSFDPAPTPAPVAAPTTFDNFWNDFGPKLNGVIR